jgi:hypothetical protein
MAMMGGGRNSKWEDNFEFLYLLEIHFKEVYYFND